MTANPSQGIRVERTGPIRLTHAGRVALPLTIGNNGQQIGTTSLVLTYEQAAALHAELLTLLNLPADSGDTP